MTTQWDRERLEEEVRQRTIDLVRANEKLQKEYDERGKIEQALRDEQLHQRQLLQMSEREQRLLAYEIHDGFVQPATAALMHLQAGLSVYASNPTETLNMVARESFVRGLQLLQESISEVRWLISGLRPVVLDDLGLLAAVDKLILDIKDRAQVAARSEGAPSPSIDKTGDYSRAEGRSNGPEKDRSRPAIDWSHQVAFDRLPPELETAIFRIIQEALRNALRHSRTERIEIALTQIEKTVVVSVQDWGCGFDLSLSKPGHFGLEGMRERARMAGGAARIESAPGLGTRVTAEFPIP